MRAWRHWIAAAAMCSVSLVVPAGASEPQQATTPRALPATPPSVFTGQQGRAGFEAMGLRGFSVALVVGDLAGAATADNVPAGAKKALADMRDFLPYKSYRLLDTHWILCCSAVPASVAGRLRGAEEEEYSFTVSVRPAGSNWEQRELGITFSLRDLGGTADEAHAVSTAVSSSERSRRMTELLRERADLQRRHDELEQKVNDNHPTRQKLQRDMENNARQMRELEQTLASTRTTSRRDTRPVLDSTFSMKVGETVVIGTSRLKGDKALIALLTAASRNSTPPRESRN